MTRRRPAPAFALTLTLLASAAFVPTARADVDACISGNDQSIALRKQGKLREALKQATACSDPSCPSEITSDCTHRIDEIDAAMPTLILAAKDGSGNDLYAVKVSMDGAPLLSSLDGRPLSIDPGEHTFRFETQGQPPVEKDLVLREGEKDRRETVVLGPPAPAPAPESASLPSTAPTPAESNWSTRKTLALVAGGVGVVGVGLGIAFGVLASSDQSQEKSNCSSSSCSDRGQAVADYNTANQNATVSTVAFVAGGVLVAAGAVLWFTAPSTSNGAPASARRWRVGPSLTQRSAEVVLGGAF